MPRGNPSPKLAITIDPDISREHPSGGRPRRGERLSLDVTNVAREALRRRAGLAAIEQWEKQYGRFTEEEMKEARRKVRAQLQTSRTARRPA